MGHHRFAINLKFTRQFFMIFLRFAFIVILFTCGYLQRPEGQEPPPPQLTLMCVSAHPDDEGGATLAYYARIKGVKTYSIFFTRGEGGQNEIGSELYDDLGSIRTKETMDAAKMIGSEVYFLGFPDFGYSKTAKETFPRWGGKDSAIARLVYYIRALKPDVIITNHDTVTTGPNRQHGNHQAAGIAAYEAFERASDPSYHPEQLHDGVTPWQVKKLFVRFYDRDSALIHQPPVATDVMRKDSSGTSIYDIALAALQKHRSQGMFRLSPQQRYYLLRQNTNYVFDNANLFSGIEPAVRETIRIKDEEPAHYPSAQDSNKTGKTTARVAQNIHVGLVKTYDETIEHILLQYHIKFTILDSSKLAEEQLDGYSVIVLDLRVCQYRKDVLDRNTKLLAYVRGGGNLVVLYNKQDDWNGKNVPPYPLTLTSERVTEEDSHVTMLLPGHRLLSAPNKITSEDWNGWIQERSIYLPSNDTAKTSSQYQRLLAMSDTDEQQPPTSLLWAQYGRGTYTYCCLVLYRQLRIENDGALKLFFNMISQPSH